ncbi:hypothetical protein SERLA73DRAFT_184113 [Serpula lacrymans var. lacrymans S7.3]|uniref:Phytanoyl-CoA dioxygenase n=2 Tax=Serpula lacrymans var. lacrymans TaxID=341189 RepID=F8Q2K4_SERL3|nr:uncharacterized protein SERLADRAFT_471619 [Serpula lacrymans var. lacrymans S7.9]EGN97415.1 hypothetical protein SERLA73DRAFT_184113 [Serpula lacrymans var. lacrymans S7.3]EGO23007.1 hypothetical protein SERLADRAFT_471619 [Serpula lacrymans var. lacrymans S7.9]
MMSSLKTQYEDQGFVIIPDLILPQDFKDIEAACERVITRTRSGSWSHRRTVGKQFPPFDNNNPDSWGVQHIMHPDLGESVFAKWYTSDKLVGAAQGLLGCQEAELQMELFNLLINPLFHNFALRWHRDDVKEDATGDEECIALAQWGHGVQWNTAIYKDSCLYVVPKSHKLPRSAEQRAQSMTLTPPEDPLTMPEAIQVTLQPGETVFYNSNILHCATYDSTQQRATLHACMGDIRGGSTRARNVLQHGLEWMKGDQFREQLDGRGQKMLSALIAMQEGVTGDIGYSLSN